MDDDGVSTEVDKFRRGRYLISLKAICRWLQLMEVWQSAKTADELLQAVRSHLNGLRCRLPEEVSELRNSDQIELHCERQCRVRVLWKISVPQHAFSTTKKGPLLTTRRYDELSPTASRQLVSGMSTDDDDDDDLEAVSALRLLKEGTANDWTAVGRALRRHVCAQTAKVVLAMRLSSSSCTEEEEEEEEDDVVAQIKWMADDCDRRWQKLFMSKMEQSGTVDRWLLVAAGAHRRCAAGEDQAEVRAFLANEWAQVIERSSKALQVNVEHRGSTAMHSLTAELEVDEAAFNTGDGLLLPPCAMQAIGVLRRQQRLKYQARLFLGGLLLDAGFDQEKIERFCRANGMTEARHLHTMTRRGRHTKLQEAEGGRMMVYTPSCACLQRSGGGGIQEPLEQTPLGCPFVHGDRQQTVAVLTRDVGLLDIEESVALVNSYPDPMVQCNRTRKKIYASDGWHTSPVGWMDAAAAAEIARI